jgi:hypothetical protein
MLPCIFIPDVLQCVKLYRPIGFSKEKDLVTSEEHRKPPTICDYCGTPIEGAGTVQAHWDGKQYVPVMNAHPKCFQEVADKIGQPDESEVPEGTQIKDVWATKVWEKIAADPKWRRNI